MEPVPAPAADADARELAGINRRLARLSAAQRVAWALSRLPGEHVLSSSFGAQAAVALHLATRERPGLPVILVDTGYLFPETHRFAARLVDRLGLDLRVYRPDPRHAWPPERVRGLRALGADGIDRYNAVHKVEPMRRALHELGAGTWIAGPRRAQSESRRALDFLARRDGRWKLLPIADWTDRDVDAYLARHRLPRHPLRERGYPSIGDVHATRRQEPGMREEDTRFFGLRRECGLHVDDRTGGD